MVRTIAMLVLLAGLVPAVHAQDAEEPAGGVPSLDELLGLDEGDDDAAAEPDAGPSVEDAELEDALSPGESGDRLEQAAALMDLAAGRLGDGRDPGLQTQRVQADILAKLDQVISSAREQQSQNSSSGGSSSSSSSGAQQGTQQSSAQSNAAGDGNTPGLPSADTTADPRGLVAPDAASWGALPDRVRDALTQGLADRYSTLYERMTREYYLRLAEEGSR